MSSFLDRLRERKLVQWALAYLAGGWLLLQVVHLLGEQFAVPGGLLRAITVLIGIGFFVTLVVAWYHGEQGRQRVSGPELLILAMLMVIAGGVVWLIGPGAAGDTVPASGTVPSLRAATPEAAASHDASVAVLPFDNLSGGPESDYFSEGVTEEIIGALARVDGLKVISRTSVVALKGSRLTLPQIADTLGVRHVLEGSVRRAGDRVRVTAQLIDPRTDSHLWAESFDRDLVDILAVQEEIARQVSNALLHRIERAPAPRTATGVGTEAYDAYLRGTFLRHRPSRANLLAAMRAFEEAIALDSTYAPAFAGLAYADVLWVLFAYVGEPQPYDAVRRALRAAERAVTLDPASAEAFAARGHARLRAWWPADDVVGDINRAIELAPNSAELRLLRGVALAFDGRFHDAVVETDAAVALDPLAPPFRDFRAMSLVLARRYDEAVREARLASALEPAFLNPRRQEARALLMLQRHDECLAVDVGPYVMLHAMCHHAAGATRQADELARSLARAVESDASQLQLHAGALAGDLAEYHAWIGDLDGTIHWLRRSAELSPISQFLVTETATYDRVRAVPRFREELSAIRTAVRRRIESQRP
jgi:TolB-like protein